MKGVHRFGAVPVPGAGRPDGLRHERASRGPSAGAARVVEWGVGATVDLEGPYQAAVAAEYWVYVQWREHDRWAIESRGHANPSDAQSRCDYLMFRHVPKGTERDVLASTVTGGAERRG